MSNSVAEKERAFKVMQAARNRRIAAERQLEILTDPKYQAAVQIDYNLILDCQRRAAEAQIAYYRALTAYAVALKNVYLETGSLMDYCNIKFSEDLTTGAGPHG